MGYLPGNSGAVKSREESDAKENAVSYPSESIMLLSLKYADPDSSPGQLIPSESSVRVVAQGGGNCGAGTAGSTSFTGGFNEARHTTASSSRNAVNVGLLVDTSSSACAKMVSLSAVAESDASLGPVRAGAWLETLHTVG